MKKSSRLLSLGLLALAVWPGAAAGADTRQEVRLDGETVIIRPAVTAVALPGRVFAAGGRTTLILAAPDLGEAGRAAAADIERYLPLACGGRAVASADARPAHDFTLLLATSRSQEFLSRAGAGQDLPSLGEHECLILPVERFSDGRPGLAVVGGSPRGLLNGVYTLLERTAGIFWDSR